jgi:hypothetical protein
MVIPLFWRATNHRRAQHNGNAIHCSPSYSRHHTAPSTFEFAASFSVTPISQQVSVTAEMVPVQHEHQPGCEDATGDAFVYKCGQGVLVDLTKVIK